MKKLLYTQWQMKKNNNDENHDGVDEKKDCKISVDNTQSEPFCQEKYKGTNHF